MGTVLMWILAIGWCGWGFYQYRKTGLPLRFSAFPIWGSAVVGLLVGILFVFSGTGIEGVGVGLATFGIILGAFALYRNRRDKSQRQLQQMFDQNPDMHEKFQNHWLFGRQVRRHDEKQRKTRKS